MSPPARRPAGAAPTSEADERAPDQPERRRTRVLIVDDSPSYRAALAQVLGAGGEVEVVGQAAEGRAAVALVGELRPDVILMDVMMPVMDGIEATRAIMNTHPSPIVLMSVMARYEEHRTAIQALDLKVVDFTDKPKLVGPEARASIAAVLRRIRTAALMPVPSPTPAPAPRRCTLQVIVIAASTGGPPALQRVLAHLSLQSPPVVVAQHLVAPFTDGFPAWIATATGRPAVKVDEHAPLERGSVYVAGEQRHLRLREGIVEAQPADPSELTPSADLLFLSTAAVYGPAAMGIVLTGMGRDGARGLLAMRQAGAWTVAQDEQSSVVYGMPRSAFEAGACCEVLTLDEMADRIARLPGDQARRPPP